MSPRRHLAELALHSAILLTSFSSTAAAGSILVFDNFGPGDTLNGTACWTFGAGLYWNDGGHTSAYSFLVPESGYLSTVETAVRKKISEESTLVLSVMSDSSGQPGAVLESFTQPLPNETLIIQSFDSVGRPVLTAGESYWLAYATEDLVNEAGGVGIGFSDGPQTYYRVGESGPWNPLGLSYGAFRITAESLPGPIVDPDPIVDPEPAVVWLVGTGLVMLGLAKRCRLRA